MPTEERFITFGLEEIFQAVQIKAIKDKIEVPQIGELTKIEMDEMAHPEKIITLYLQQGEKSQIVKLERTFFATALVFFCQGCGIPLPARGKKTLNILPDKIIMKIELISKSG